MELVHIKFLCKFLLNSNRYRIQTVESDYQYQTVSVTDVWPDEFMNLECRLEKRLRYDIWEGPWAFSTTLLSFTTRIVLKYYKEFAMEPLATADPIYSYVQLPAVITAVAFAVMWLHVVQSCMHCTTKLRTWEWRRISCIESLEREGGVAATAC